MAWIRSSIEQAEVIDQMRHEIIQGDNMDVLPTLPADSIDSMVTDPPAGIAFMGKAWDSHSGYEARTEAGQAIYDALKTFQKAMQRTNIMRLSFEDWAIGFVAFTTDWSTEAYRVLKPGAHALVWALPRTSDLTELGLRAAGFEIRDVVTHLFGSGFPKSLDVSKAIDEFLGTERPVVGEKEQRNPYIGSDGLQFRDAPDYTGQTEAITAPGSDEAARFDGWGTALKPSSEHWILCRKPLGEDTVATNVLKHGTGAINIDDCRTRLNGEEPPKGSGKRDSWREKEGRTDRQEWNGGNVTSTDGRWPSNLVLTHHADCKRAGPKTVASDRHDPAERGAGGLGTAGHKGQTGLAEQRLTEETVDAWFCAPGCPVYELDLLTGDRPSGARKAGARKGMGYHGAQGDGGPEIEPSEGGASRFFPQFAWTVEDRNAALFLYCAKASRSERNAKCETLEERDMLWSSGTHNPGSFQAEGTNRKARNFHPTVKPIELMRWLCRLITPPGGLVLDPFLGSGTTEKACVLEGFDCIGIEREADYVAIARARTQGDQLRLFG